MKIAYSIVGVDRQGHEEVIVVQDIGKLHVLSDAIEFIHLAHPEYVRLKIDIGLYEVQ